MDANREIKSLQPINSRSKDKRKKKIEEPSNFIDSTLKYLPEGEVRPKRRTTKTQGHKYNIVLPDPQFDELQRVVKRWNTNIQDFTIRSVILGVIVAEHGKLEPGAYIIIRREGLPDEKLTFLV